MIKNLLTPLLSFLVSHILADPFSVKTSLIHTNKTNGGEVVVKCAEIALGVRIESFFKKLGDNSSLNLERTSGNIHHSVKSFVEVLVVFREISESGHINGNNADRACALAASKEAARFLSEFS